MVQTPVNEKVKLSASLLKKHPISIFSGSVVVVEREM